MFDFTQVLLILVWFTIYNVFSAFGFGLVAGGVVLHGVVVGTIVGDPALGLMLGGTYELMNIGLNPLGGSSVPNYNVGVVVGTAFGAKTGLETGIAIGIVVATLSSSLDVFSKTVGSVFLHRAQKAISEKQFTKATTWIRLGLIPRIFINSVLPLFVVFVFGAPIVEAINQFIPQWLLAGFKNAGNVLPALGFAILLRSMNIKGNFQYLIIGFFMFAFLKVGAIGAAVVGVALALMAYKSDMRNEMMIQQFGGDDDE